MRNICLTFLCLCVACGKEVSQDSNGTLSQQSTDNNEVYVPQLQQLLDSFQLVGGILVYDDSSETYFSNDVEWAKKGALPASTFKIINSIIGLETGVVESDSTMFTWNGEDRALDVWEQDLTLKQAFHFSCVPCYQEVARGIGTERMNTYLAKLDYGKMDVDSSNIDMFWLRGNSRITQYEQIDILRRFHYAQLPISSRTDAIMRKMMIREETEEYILRGKTGWAIREDGHTGWYVGYIEKADKSYFFATHVEPDPTFDMEMFPEARIAFTEKALEQLGIL